MSRVKREKVIVGADHGGFGIKAKLVAGLVKAGYSVLDVGTFSPEPCDYPKIGAKVAKAVSSGLVPRGVLLCKSGGGMAIVANKFPGVRAVVCETVSSARHAREHNDSNVLVLGAEHMPLARAKAVLRAWLTTPFAGGRHARRVRQILQIEKTVCSLKTK